MLFGKAFGTVVAHSGGEDRWGPRCVRNAGIPAALFARGQGPPLCLELFIHGGQKISFSALLECFTALTALLKHFSALLEPFTALLEPLTALLEPFKTLIEHFTALLEQHFYSLLHKRAERPSGFPALFR